MWRRICKDFVLYAMEHKFRLATFTVLLDAIELLYLVLEYSAHQYNLLARSLALLTETTRLRSE